MVLGTRLRALVAGASALAAMAIAITVAGRGCNADKQQIDSTVRAFLAAAKADDRSAVLDLLGPKSRARLEHEAKRATELVGGSRRFEATTMLSLGAIAEGREPRVTVIGPDGDIATAEVVFSDSTKWRLNMVRTDNSWRVELFSD